MKKSVKNNRILALLLCVLMVCQSIPILSSFADSGKPEKIIIDFESSINVANMNLSKGNVGIYNSDVDGYLPQNVYEGAGSFKVEHNQDGGNLNFRFKDYTFKAGSKYRLTFNYKTNTSIWTYFVDPEKYNTTLNSADWTTYSRIITFSSDTSYFEIGQTTADGIAYFDNIILSPLYSISANSSDSFLGSASVSINEAAEDDSVIFTAVPTASGKFSYWKDSKGTTVSDQNPYTLSTIIGDTTLTAVFESKSNSYQLLSFDDSANVSNQHVAAGVAELYTASSGDANLYAGTGSLKVSHNSQSGNLRLFLTDASFKAKQKYQITLNIKSDKEAWFYLVNSEKFGFTASVGEWKTVTKTVTFDNDCSYLEIGTTTKDATTYIDEIEIKEYLKVTAESNNENLGSVVVSPSEVLYGSTATFTATAVKGASFMSWESESGNEESTTNPYTVNNITADLKLIAVFAATSTGENYLDFEIPTQISNMNLSKGTAERYVPVILPDNNVYDGNAAFKLCHNAEKGILNVYFKNFKLKKDKTYAVSFWYKTDVTAWTFVIDGGKYGITLEPGGWKKAEKIIKTTSDISYLEFGTSQISSTIYLDNISVDEVYSTTAISTNEDLGTVSVSNQASILGSSVTFTATPQNGCTFIGWKNKDSSEILSTKQIYTVTNVNSDISLVAYFEGDPLPLAMQFLDFEDDVNFTNMNMSSGSMGVYSSSEAKIYEGEKSFVLEHNANSGNLNLRFRNFKFKSGITYRISFWYKVTDKTWLYIADSSKYGITLTSDDWCLAEKDITFENNCNYLEIGTTTKSAKIYFDNIRADIVYKTVAVSGNDELGTAFAEDTSVFAGGTMKFTAKPKNGCKFNGWHKENDTAIISMNDVYTVENINSDISLIAEFTGTPQPTERQIVDFEDGRTIQNRNSKCGTAQLYNSSLKNFNSKNVYKGDASLQISHNNEKGNLQISINDIELYGSCIYEISFYYKTNKEAWIYCDSVDTNAWLKSKDWALFTTRIIPEKNKDYLELGITTLGAEVYIDDITIVYKKTYSIAAISKDTCLGSVTVSSVVAAEGDKVQFAANPINGYHLASWRNEAGEIISRSKTYTAVINGDITLYAYFEKNSLPGKSQDFENPIQDKMDRGFSWNYKGETGFSSSGVHSGNGSLKFVSNFSWQFYTADASILLEPNTSYEITLWYKTETNVNFGDKSISFIDFEGIDEANNRAYLKTTGGDWQKVKKSLKTKDFPTTIRLGMYQVENDVLTVYFDDISVEKVNIYKNVPKIQTIDFDSKVPQTAYFTWNTDKKFTRNDSKGSLKFDGTKLTEKHSSYTLPDIEVEPFSKYTASIWVKGLKNAGFGKAQFYLVGTGAYISLGVCMDEWKELSFSFSTGNIETNVLSLELIGYADDIFYVDDFTLTKADDKGTYCEELYNLIRNGAFESEVTEKNFGTLDKAMTVTDKLGQSGTHSLEIMNGLNNYVLPINIKKPGRYVFAFSHINENDDVATVNLLSDRNGKLLDTVRDNKSSKFVLSATQKWQRESIVFDITKENKTVYLQILNCNSNLNIDDLALFDIRYAYEEDPNDYTPYIPYDYDYFEPSKEDSAKTLNDKTVSDKTIDVGEKVFITIIFAFVVALAVGVTFIVRRKKNAKK